MSFRITNSHTEQPRHDYDEMDWWTRWCNAPRWETTVRDYNSQRGDEVRCINCDRRIYLAQPYRVWLHFQTKLTLCEPVNVATPPTNYRP